MQGIREILDFWFGDEARAQWFDASPAFDQTIRKRFAELFARAATGELTAWEDDADGCLALCILLGQMPRSMFRNDPRSFGTDDKAIALAEHAVREGHDRRMQADEKQFFYMPFMQSESLANQLRALALCESAGLRDARELAVAQVAIIRRFGRFPERNQILQRISSDEELGYLSEREAEAHNRDKAPRADDLETDHEPAVDLEVDDHDDDLSPRRPRFEGWPGRSGVG